MFRHVVMFAWDRSTSAESRQAVVEELHEFAAAMADLATIVVHVDAGLADDNFDIAVVSDFPDQQTYEAYRDDQRHRALVNEQLAPVVHRRAALQSELV